MKKSFILGFATGAAVIYYLPEILRAKNALVAAAQGQPTTVVQNNHYGGPTPVAEPA